MIAQTMVEYGGLQSISATLSYAFSRLETYVWSGNSKYLLLGIAVIVVLALTRRR
jgi:hypothetical protein